MRGVVKGALGEWRLSPVTLPLSVNHTDQIFCVNMKVLNSCEVFTHTFEHQCRFFCEKQLGKLNVCRGFVTNGHKCGKKLHMGCIRNFNLMLRKGNTTLWFDKKEHSTLDKQTKSRNLQKDSDWVLIVAQRSHRGRSSTFIMGQKHHLYLHWQPNLSMYPCSTSLRSTPHCIRAAPRPLALMHVILVTL